MCHVDTQASVKSVIERVMSSTDAKECKKWAISEVMERGGGAWFKVSRQSLSCSVLLTRCLK